MKKNALNPNSGVTPKTFPQCSGGQRCATATAVVQTDSALHWRESKNWMLLDRKTPIWKIFSQNILYICVEHYYDALNFIRKYGTSSSTTFP